MKNVNNLFLEQYKRTDNICKDSYNSDTGITNYINIMRDVKNYNAQRVAGWDETLKMLTHLRHIRNKLTHDVGTLDMELCSEDDVMWLCDFCDSILSATDPLACYYRAQRIKEVKSTKKRQINIPEYSEPPKKSKKRTAITIIATLAFLAVCVFVFYLLVELYKATI